jgi:SAM-dependent methyltransferase
MLVMLPREKRWQVIREMNRLLKPGGRLAFLDSRPECGNQWMSAEEWRKGLRSIGLRNIEITERGDVFLNVIATKLGDAGEITPPITGGKMTGEGWSETSGMSKVTPVLVT